MPDLSEDQDPIEKIMTDAAVWAICALALGAGPGKCEPFEGCCCGEEGRSVATAIRAALSAADYRIAKVRKPVERPPLVMQA